jgi:CHASE2 domain-containing sensor protein
MNKRIVIKIGSGSLSAGYSAAVQIGDEGAIPQAETQAFLPPAPDLADLYHRWQQSYWQLGLPSRITACDGITNVSVASDMEHCRTLSRQLRDRIHNWLDGNEFRPIREKILEQLHPKDQARILLQTQDPLLQRLPWYELHFFERYRYAEVGICAPDYQRVSHANVREGAVRILAVLGDDTGLNTQTDQRLLTTLANADVHFLNQPNREDFNRCLWDERGWDILFFAGHSRSHLAGLAEGRVQDTESSGEISLNSNDKLTIPQLKHALQKAIDRGLNTAIFNSCDGLGLAADLSDLHIPQVLVMREPVPDRVAHAFLQGFLDSFSAGNSFYLSVREAREKLQGLESHFPCATWLPVIVQNLAETPPTWLSLQGRSQVLESVTVSHSSHSLSSSLGGFSRSNAFLSKVSQPLSQSLTHKQRLKSGLACTVFVAIALTTLRLLGLLEPSELKAYDHFLRSRPTEALDERLLIITNTADDIAKRPPTGSSSLDDRTLLEVLDKLKSLSPALIGLDIYRPQPTKDPKLAQALAETENLIAICKVTDNTQENTEAYASPPEITDLTRIGASDYVAQESTGAIVRLHLLKLDPPPNSPCMANYTLSTVMALKYLESHGGVIDPAETQKLTRTFGGYHNLDTSGGQLLLNYRRLRDPKQTHCGDVKEAISDCLSVTEFLGKSSADLQRYRDRIVLIGTTDLKYAEGDRWRTPYTRNLLSAEEQSPGVFLQAQMISQLLSAAQDNRPLIKSWPEWQEVIWIMSWAMLGAFVGAYTRWQVALWLRLLLGEGILLLICWLWFMQLGLWIPWVPSAIALPVSAIATQTSLKLVRSQSQTD